MHLLPNWQPENQALHRFLHLLMRLEAAGAAETGGGGNGLLGGVVSAVGGAADGCSAGRRPEQACGCSPLLWLPAAATRLNIPTVAARIRQMSQHQAEGNPTTSQGCVRKEKSAPPNRRASARLRPPQNLSPAWHSRRRFNASLSNQQHTPTTHTNKTLKASILPGWSSRTEVVLRLLPFSEVHRRPFF